MDETLRLKWLFGIVCAVTPGKSFNITATFEGYDLQTLQSQTRGDTSGSGAAELWSPAVGWQAGTASRANLYAWGECLDPISSLDREGLNGCQVNSSAQVLILPRVYAYTTTAYSAAE